MTDPLLTKYDAPGSPRAMILVLHGGKPRSHQAIDGRSASWRRALWLQRDIAAAGPRRRASASGSCATASAAGTAAPTGAPTPGGRSTSCAPRTATYPSSCSGTRWARAWRCTWPTTRRCVGVVGLAPWWSAEDPVLTLAGRTLQAAHGRRDRITSFRETTRYVERATAVADGADLRDMGALGHYMLTGSARWHDVAIASSLAILGAHVRGH